MCEEQAGKERVLQLREFERNYQLRSPPLVIGAEVGTEIGSEHEAGLGLLAKCLSIDYSIGDQATDRVKCAHLVFRIPFSHSSILISIYSCYWRHCQYFTVSTFNLCVLCFQTAALLRCLSLSGGSVWWESDGLLMTTNVL